MKLIARIEIRCDEDIPNQFSFDSKNTAELVSIQFNSIVLKVWRAAKKENTTLM